jgi:hypothetical protein
MDHTWVPVLQKGRQAISDLSVADGGREQSFLRFPRKIGPDFQRAVAEERNNLIVIHF